MLIQISSIENISSYNHYYNIYSDDQILRNENVEDTRRIAASTIKTQ